MIGLYKRQLRAMAIKARDLIVEVVIKSQLRKYSLWKFQQHYALPGEVPAVGELPTRQFDSELHLQAKYASSLEYYSSKHFSVIFTDATQNLT